MRIGQPASLQTVSGGVVAAGFGCARRMLRRQLDTLRRLASAAVRLADEATRRVVPDIGGVGALEKAVRLHGKVAWALRLIEALRARLAEDLDRVERGQPPEFALTGLAADPETREDHDASEADSTARERPEHEGAERGERLERENFGRFFSRRSDDAEFARILQRPTDEIITLICKELGLSPDWLRHVEEAWEQQETGEDSVSSPFPLDGGRVGDEGGALSGKPRDG